MSKTTNKQYNIENTSNLDRNLSDNFTLENLSANLMLSLERAKIIHELYENNNSLKEKSNRLTRALDNEKNINNLQSEFVSLVSHEFKTPLSIIKASSDVLKLCIEDAPEADLIHKQLDKIDKAIVRMTALIDSTLNLSKLETGKLQFSPSLFSIQACLTDIITGFQDMHKDVKFISNIDLDEEFYNGDKSLIEQAFINLISNAVKYSAEAPEIQIEAKKTKDHYTITIADNGIGIQARDLTRLFSKFYRASNSIGIAGTGIGLYLVKKFIDLHHGDIKVESELNKGTKFIITLPIG